MRALTVRQPWAHCLLGLKTGRRKHFELRGWTPTASLHLPSPGDRIAIHAAANRSPAVRKAVLNIFGHPGHWTYGGPASDHRGDLRIDDAILGSTRLAFGAIIGTVRLRAVWRVDAHYWPRVELDLVAGDVTRDKRSLLHPDTFLDSAWWRECAYAWELDEPRRLARPIPARGTQGLWTVPEELLR